MSAYQATRLAHRDDTPRGNHPPGGRGGWSKPEANSNAHHIPNAFLSEILASLAGNHGRSDFVDSCVNSSADCIPGTVFSRENPGRSTQKRVWWNCIASKQLVEWFSEVVNEGSLCFRLAVIASRGLGTIQPVGFVKSKSGAVVVYKLGDESWRI